MDQLTERQAAVLAFVERFVAEHGYPPTRSEISEAFGFASHNAAEQHLRALECKGRLTLTPGISRGIALPPPARSSRR